MFAITYGFATLEIAVLRAQPCPAQDVIPNDPDPVVEARGGALQGSGLYPAIEERTLAQSLAERLHVRSQKHS